MHNLAQARRVANYAAFFWMTERIGQLIEFGRSQTLFDSPKPQLTAAYVTGINHCRKHFAICGIQQGAAFGWRYERLAQ
ncbi:MAG: hypothetical protein Q7J38_14405 [Gallionella sp.]|nr:hypothetical protein [Gallionella sp.]